MPEFCRTHPHKPGLVEPGAGVLLICLLQMYFPRLSSPNKQNSGTEPARPAPNPACAHCGGAVKVNASIEDPAVIKQILAHLKQRAEAATQAFRPFARAPPRTDLRAYGN